MGVYAWLLVLREQKKDFAPEDWSQIAEALAAVEKQLDPASVKKAEVGAVNLMRQVAEHDMDRFARQQ